METKVILNAYQEVPASDLNAMQDLTQSSLDSIVRYTLFDERKYYGVNATKDSAFQVQVASGKVFYQGRVYNKSDVTSHSLASYTPSSGSRIILAVLSIDEVDTAVATRKFLIDATTRQTQPKPVATRHARVATVDFVAGTQSGSPVRPAVPSGYLAFAQITMTTSGIVDIDMITDNQVTKLEDVIASLEVVNDILDEHTAQFATLRNDLASIRKDIRTMPVIKDIDDIQSQLLSIREAVELPDLGSNLGLDNFETDDESDIANGAYDAYVYRGLHFKPAAEIVKVPSLLSSSDTNVLVDVSSGLVLPKPNAALVLRVNAAKRVNTADIVLGNYDAHSRSFRLQLPARNYWYYGTGTHAQEEATLRQRDRVKLYNPITKAYELITLRDRSWHLETINQSTNFYRIVSTEPYWDVAVVSESISTNMVCQTWLEGTGGWYSEIDIGVTQKDSAANLRVYIVECDEGTGYPIDDRAIAATTIANADVKVWSGTAAVWTTAKFSPFYLCPGKSYGIYVAGTGTWRLAAGSNDLASQSKNGISLSGVLFLSSSYTVQVPDTTRDMCFRTKAFTWPATLRYVALDGVSLSGGISRLQAVLSGYEPPACDVTIQAQVNGAWVEVNEKNATAFASKPDVLPLRLAFKGTTSTQPGIYLNQSVILAQRQKLNATHISTRRTTDDNAAKIVVSEVSADFVEARHNWDVRLMRGVNYATDVTTSDVKTSFSAGKWRRNWTFSGLGGLNDYKIKTLLSTTDSNDTFSVQRRSDSATP